MKLVFLALMVFLLFTPSYAADQELLPKEFLGYWEPLSSTTGEIGLDIKDGGKIYRRHHKKVLGEISYRYIHRTSYRSYLVVKDGQSGKPSFSFWRIRIERSIQENRNVLWLEHYSCSLLTAKAFETFLQQSLYDLLNAEKCDPDKAAINLDTYIRKAGK